MDQEQQQRLMKEYNLASGYSSHKPQQEASPGLTALVDKATQNSGHIFFGEPHFDGMIIKQYELLANNPEAFKVAAKNGVKHLALELPQEFQSHVDDFVAGKTTREEFKKSLDDFKTPWAEGVALDALKENITRTVENAKDARMKVHFADVTWKNMQDLTTPEQHAVVYKIMKEYEEKKPNITVEQYMINYVANMPTQEREDLFRGIRERKEEMQARRFDDSQQYSYLRQRIPLGEGIMGVVGLKHLDNNMDTKTGIKTRGIDDYLEEEGSRVTSVEVHTARTHDNFREEYQLNGNVKKDPPDYTIILDQKRILDRESNDAGRLDQLQENPVQLSRLEMGSPVVPLAF